MVRNYRFFISSAKDIVDLDTKTIRIKDSDLIHQIKDVLRLNKGSNEKLNFICDFVNKKNTSNQAQNESLTIYEASIDEVHSKEIVCNIEKETQATRELDLNIRFFVPIIKIDAFEFMIRKLTELGVQTFVPVIFERSQKQYVEKLNKTNQEQRLKKIIQEATEQCEGAVLARLLEPIKFSQLEGLLNDESHNKAHSTKKNKRISEKNCEWKNELRIFASERLASEQGLKLDQHEKNIQQVRDIRVNQFNIGAMKQDQNPGDLVDISLLVGPEGGLSDAEVKMLENLNFKPHSLGKRLLKAETAAVVLFASLDCF